MEFPTIPTLFLRTMADAVVNLEKSELSSRYEKLSAICRSQRQELLELPRQIKPKNFKTSLHLIRKMKQFGSLKRDYSN